MTGNTEPEGTARHREDATPALPRARGRRRLRSSGRRRRSQAPNAESTQDSQSAQLPQDTQIPQNTQLPRDTGISRKSESPQRDPRHNKAARKAETPRNERNPRRPPLDGRRNGGDNVGGSGDEQGNRKLWDFLRRVDRDPRLLAVADWLRDRVPGDRHYGDPLSVGGNTASDLLGRRLASFPAEQPSAFRELGMGALQVWQAHASRYPQDAEGRELAVLFTDLAGFSDWTLQVGDETALELLRRVGAEIEPLIQRKGTVVKRLGDGLMAVFEDPDAAVAIASASRDAVDGVIVDGHCLRLRAGVHVGRPQHLGNDFFGRDVNIAARVAAAADGGEVLISSSTREKLTAPPRLRRRTSFTAKGVPEDLNVYTVAGT